MDTELKVLLAHDGDAHASFIADIVKRSIQVDALRARSKQEAFDLIKQNPNLAATITHLSLTSSAADKEGLDVLEAISKTQSYCYRILLCPKEAVLKIPDEQRSYFNAHLDWGSPAGPSNMLDDVDDFTPKDRSIDHTKNDLFVLSYDANANPVARLSSTLKDVRARRIQKALHQILATQRLSANEHV